MKLSEYRRLMSDEFGSAYAGVLGGSHVLQQLGNRTPDEALAEGVKPREVWLALCRDLQIPEERWLGRDLPLSERRNA
ncbi:DUF3046 domain-containing protein [Flexivirga caeni]|uniref:DUF3046 domain-containing protein n=1 Tax=Flexivirga caeni TaxID=2294115 RepID=A0A3M9M885_9MICO|nr:DUF3046 domain-containing protein [Flexivirga caeni]RNI21415.1 DUF3046 domain-containing protein [Flexivirga caeni]